MYIFLETEKLPLTQNLIYTCIKKYVRILEASLNHSGHVTEKSHP
jgi:hypothetical protein